MNLNNIIIITQEGITDGHKLVIAAVTISILSFVQFAFHYQMDILFK